MLVCIKVIIKDLELIPVCVPVWTPGADGDSSICNVFQTYCILTTTPFLIQTLVAGAFWFLGNFISTLDPLASLINDRNKQSGVYLELSLLGCFQLWGGIRTVNFTFFCLLGIVHKKKKERKFSHRLLTLMSYQTCMIYVLLWDTKEKVLKVKEDKNCQAPKGQINK